MNANDHDDIASADADPDILRSDPEQRRKVQWLIGAMAAAAVLLWLFGLPALQRWLNVPDPTVFSHRMGLVCYGLSVVLLATAAYAASYARRIFGSSQFPPPGTWVMKDTRVLRGDHARARGWWVAACALSFALIAAYATVFLPGSINALLMAPPAPHALTAPPAHG